MRMMMTVSIPVEAGNEAIRNGKLMATVQKMMAEVKPEAAYFIADPQGNRSGMIVFDMKNSSEIPGLAEPWFLAMKAQVHFQPAMSVQDLAAAGPGIEKAVKES